MTRPVLRGPFTVDAYHRLAELGVSDEDDRVELLDGQIVEMTPIGGAHAACVIYAAAEILGSPAYFSPWTRSSASRHRASGANLTASRSPTSTRRGAVPHTGVPPLSQSRTMKCPVMHRFGDMPDLPVHQVRPRARGQSLLRYRRGDVL